jgi:hypothetical protein
VLTRKRSAVKLDNVHHVLGVKPRTHKTLRILPRHLPTEAR